MSDLRHSTDSDPGYRRAAARDGFEYYNRHGRKINAAPTRDRIRALAIPPAWTDVWICADPHGHLQATGRDARGRKQYRYATRWRELRDAHKFDRLAEFARALPAIRRRARTDLALPGLPRRKVLAAIVRLLESTCFRIGNERYAEQNDSFGLTTLRNRHLRVANGRVAFQFRGKSGKFHAAAIGDERVARIVRHCGELPGQALFQYLDENGKPQAIGSADVNDYLKEIAAADVSAKDFRTWAGSVLVADSLARREGPVRPSHVVAAVRAASLRLGNTPAICRKSYVHPRVLDPATWRDRGTRRARPMPRGLRAAEAALLGILAPLRAPSKGASPLRASRSTSPRAAPRPS